MNAQELIKNNIANPVWQYVLLGDYCGEEEYTAEQVQAADKFLADHEFKMLESPYYHDGSEYFLYFNLLGKTYALSGYYSSYEGVDIEDWFDFYEVKPVEKTIIVYERV